MIEGIIMQGIVMLFCELAIWQKVRYFYDKRLFGNQYRFLQMYYLAVNGSHGKMK